MLRKGRYILAAAAVSILVTIFPGPPLASKPDERILVLGFDTWLLNDIQDRLLRERIMRELRVAGLAVVPVMEIEAIFHDGREKQIRKLSRDDMKRLSGELRAGYACCGSLAPEGGTGDEAVREGGRYICSVTWYRKERNSFQEIRVPVTGEKDLYRFFDGLSKKIAGEIGTLL